MTKAIGQRKDARYGTEKKMRGSQDWMRDAGNNLEMKRKKAILC